MSVSRREFLHSLPGAVAGAPFRVDGNVIESEATPGWRIELQPLADLSVGLLALPRHRVTIRFSGYSDRETDSFLRRFELYFRRGGG